MGYYEGDLCLTNNGNNGSMFGNNGDWIWAFLLFALLGNNGWGGAGFGGGYGGFYPYPYAFGGCGGGCATQADVRAAVDQQTLISKIDQQTYGLADTFNSLNNTLNSNFRGIDNAICNLGYNIATQFAGVDKAFCTQGYQTQAGFNALANQISSCCCDLKQLNLENRYLNEKQTCEIVSAINAGNQRLVDIYTADKMASKDAKIAALESKISNAEQSAYLLNELKPCPKAAYVVQPSQPVTFPTNCCGNVSYAGFGYGSCGANVQ
jgi:hypothetical protein